MRMGFLGLTAGLVVALTAGAAPAITLFQTGFESPVQTTGFNSGALSTGWSLFSNNSSYGITRSDTTLPLPAGGNQYAVLSGTNTGISVNTGATIQAGRTYTVSAAIGKPDSSFTNTWSIQLWAGSVFGTNFIGQ